MEMNGALWVADGSMAGGDFALHSFWSLLNVRSVIGKERCSVTLCSFLVDF